MIPAAFLAAALPVAPAGLVCRIGSPEFRHPAPVELLGVSADGKRVYTAGKDAAVESEEILDRLGLLHQINTFSHVEHGFAVLCEMSQRRQKYNKEQVLGQALSWLNEYLVE